MTQQEFEGWKQWTENSKRHWTVDPIRNGKNHPEMLVHIGGENGKFMLFYPDGMLEMGSYEGAWPHIGEALFKIEGKKKFANMDDAIARAIEAGGLKFLLDFIGSRAY